MKAVAACLVLALVAGTSVAGELAITSFQEGGRLEFEQVPFAKHYRVEWAPSPAMAWTNTWDALNGIPPTGSGTVTVHVPTTYRVVATVFEHVMYSTEIVEDNLWTVNKLDGACQRVGSCLSSISALASNPESGYLYASTGGKLYLIHPGSGVATDLGPIGYSPSGLAFDEAAGVLYGVTYGGAFIRINTINAQGSLVANLNGPFLVDALAYVPDEGRLYISAIQNDTLWRIVPATGNAELVGPIGYANVSGLAFDESTDTLYGTSRGGGALIRLNRTTGAGELVGFMPYSAFQSLAVHRQ